MLRLAVIFLSVALLAGGLGFGVLTGVAASVARTLFIVSLTLFAGSLSCRHKASP